MQYTPRTQPTNPVSQTPQLNLQRCRIIRLLQRQQNTAVSRIRTNTSHQISADALEHFSARDHKRIEILLGRAIANLPPDVVAVRLLHLVRLPRRGRLVAFDAVAGDEDAVRWDGVAGLQVEDVSDGDVVDGDHGDFAGADGFDFSVVVLWVD